MPLPRAAALPVERAGLQPQPAVFVVSLGTSKHGPPPEGHQESRLLQRVLRPFRWLAADGRWAGGRGKDGCQLSKRRPAQTFFFFRVEQRDLGRAFCLEVDVSGGVAVLARGDDITAGGGGRHAPDPRHAAHFSFLPLAFLSQYVCVDIGGGVPCVFRCCCWVVPPSSSSAARWRRLLLLLEPGIRRAPHSQGGPLAVEAQTQGVQPSYSRAKFSRQVASLIMYSTCSATLERLVLSGSRPSSFIFTRRQTPTA